MNKQGKENHRRSTSKEKQGKKQERKKTENKREKQNAWKRTKSNGKKRKCKERAKEQVFHKGKGIQRNIKKNNLTIIRKRQGKAKSKET